MRRQREEFRPIHGKDRVFGDRLNLELAVDRQHAKTALGAGDGRLVYPHPLGQGGVADTLLGLPSLELLEHHGRTNMPLWHFWQAAACNPQHFPNARLALEACGPRRKPQL